MRLSIDSQHKSSDRKWEYIANAFDCDNEDDLYLPSGFEDEGVSEGENP